MYSNDQTQIRMGLVNYIGAMLKASPFPEGRPAKQNVASILTEEALKIAQDEKGVYDIYVLKPLLRGTILLCKQRCSELSKLPTNDIVIEQINTYRNLIGTLENLVSMV